MSSNKPHLVCATDFSRRSGEAAIVAAKLALLRSETLRLVHVSEETAIKRLREVKLRLDAEAERLQQDGGKVETRLLEGRNVAKELVAELNSEPASLMVVSSATKGPLDRWAMGSVAEEVAESAPVPTLVVRDPAVFETWDWSRDRLKVMLAVDLYSTSDGVLRWAKAFRLAGPCDFVTCHITRRRPGSDESDPEQSRLTRDLQKKLRDQLGDDAGEVLVRPHFGDPGPAIVELAAETKAQLIAVGTHQRRGLSRLAQFSVSRELLHQPGLNVVCVPVTARFDPRDAHLPEYRRVLVATDFSELGNAAIPFAGAACSIGGRLKIVHVARPKSRTIRRTADNSPAELRRRLTALIPAETGARIQPPEVEVLEGTNPGKAICEEAERFGADLVCLASHGLGASRALHGSVAKEILKRIRRPLLVIRRPEE